MGLKDILPWTKGENQKGGLARYQADKWILDTAKDIDTKLCEIAQNPADNTEKSEILKLRMELIKIVKGDM